MVLGEGAFSYCTSLGETVNSEKISEVGDYAFAYTALVSVDLTGATRIGDAAFLKETLTPFEVIFGENLTDIGENPFAMCKLSAFKSSVTEKFGEEEFTTVTLTYDVSDTVKVIDGMLYRVVPSGLELITYTGDSDTVTVADGTVRIAAQAFAGSGVTYVVLPSTLASIGHKAFFGCDSLSMVSFASYEAPVLEEEYDYSYWLSAENLPATGKYEYVDAYTGATVTYNGLGIVPYFMWNATETPAVIYYGANFCNYVGRVDRNITMVRPANGINYDSFIFGKYFTLTVDGGAAADATTLAAIDKINSLPENITLADKELVLIARAAYDKITSDTQRGLVTNYEKLRKAEQRISDLEYIKNDGETDNTPPEEPVITDPEAKRDTKVVWIIVLSSLLAAATALSAVFVILYVKAKRQRKYPKTSSADSSDVTD